MIYDVVRLLQETRKSEVFCEEELLLLNWNFALSFFWSIVAISLWLASGNGGPL